MGRTPKKTRASSQALVKSSLQVNADAAFARCPEGHRLPNKTDRGQCSPLVCALKNGIARLRPEKDDGTTVEERVGKVKGDEEMRIKIQQARKQTWQEFLQIPVDLKGGDAEKYADDELVNLLPFAVGVVKKQLLYGTEEQQERAALRVLDANGKAKKEAVGQQAPAVVINLPPGSDASSFFTWRKPKEVAGEAVVTPAKDEKKNA